MLADTTFLIDLMQKDERARAKAEKLVDELYRCCGQKGFPEKIVQRPRREP
ncbi:MAG: hypothetical protein OK474_09505 [Thaumarchaeota archaeon]|nr:hypothetical protein [Nitrososphaerota archaeon]